MNKGIYHPSFSEFKKKARQGNLIPIYSEFFSDLETPVSCFLKLHRGEYGFLFESVVGERKVAQYSFLGTRPFLIFKSKGNQVELVFRNGKKELYQAPRPLWEMTRILKKYKLVPDRALPRFGGGAVGYLSYDVVREFEEIPDKNKDDLNLPDCFFLFIDNFCVFDHVNQKLQVVSLAHLSSEKSLRDAYFEAVAKLEETISQLKKHQKFIVSQKRKKKFPPNVSSNLSKVDFKKAVRKCINYIKAGDIIQAVLSQRFKLKANCSEFNIYRALRHINPSPYMYYLHLGDFKIIGSSPELLVRMENGFAEERPIAGTRQRGKTESEDKKLCQELLSDPKERAEHIMLVDLARNDLGRVCRAGSVKTTELMAIEKYSHVMHIVSNVAGELKKGKDAYEVLRACFPAGTVSGAPKIRAMEIIDELEPTRRGIYAGAIGYFSFSGNLDTCITIRTILALQGMIYIQVGAGIVADSKPDREYQETLNKAKALFKAVELAERSLIWS